MPILLLVENWIGKGMSAVRKQPMSKNKTPHKHSYRLISKCYVPYQNYSIIDKLSDNRDGGTSHLWCCIEKSCPATFERSIIWKKHSNVVVISESYIESEDKYYADING